MIFTTILLDSSSANSCFNFTGVTLNETNTCIIKQERNNTPCMSCTIRYINFPIRRNCSKDFECVEFILENETIFENFFSLYKTIISALIPRNIYRSSAMLVWIRIDKANLTKITNEYINSTMNLPNSLIQMEFVIDKQISGLAIRLAENDSYFFNFPTFYIRLPCSANGYQSYYEIRKMNRTNFKLFKREVCPEFWSTTKVSSYK